MSRAITHAVEFDFDFDGTYTDVSDYVVGFSTNQTINGIDKPFASTGRIDSATIELKNTANEFSSKVTTGTYYSFVSNGGFYLIPVRVYVSTGGVSRRIFTGVATIPNEVGKTVLTKSTITVVCLSNEEIFRNNRISLPIEKTLEWVDNYPDEKTALAYIFSQIGLSCTIDSGTYPVLPLYYNESALEVIWNIAKTVGGFFYTNNSGEFIYRNASSIVGLSPVTTLYTSSYAVVQMSYDEINLAKKVVVEGVTPEIVLDDTIVSSNKTITIEAGESTILSLPFNNYAYEVSAETYVCQSGSGVDLSGDLTITKTITAKSLEIEFANGGSSRMFILNYTLTGSSLSLETFQVSSETSESFWDDRAESDITTTVRSSYIVSEGQAKSIADMVLDRQKTPIASFILTDVIYDGALNILDVITISDGSISSSDVNVLITGLTYNFSYAGGCRVKIVGIEYDPLFQYLSSDSYFIVGTNELGDDPGDDIARLFY